MKLKDLTLFFGGHYSIAHSGVYLCGWRALLCAPGVLMAIPGQERLLGTQLPPSVPSPACHRAAGPRHGCPVGMAPSPGGKQGGRGTGCEMRAQRRVRLAGMHTECVLVPGQPLWGAALSAEPLAQTPISAAFVTGTEWHEICYDTVPAMASLNLPKTYHGNKPTFKCFCSHYTSSFVLQISTGNPNTTSNKCQALSKAPDDGFFRCQIPLWPTKLCEEKFSSLSGILV